MTEQVSLVSSHLPFWLRYHAYVCNNLKVDLISARHSLHCSSSPAQSAYLPSICSSTLQYIHSSSLSTHCWIIVSRLTVYFSSWQPLYSITVPFVLNFASTKRACVMCLSIIASYVPARSPASLWHLHLSTPFSATLIKTNFIILRACVCAWNCIANNILHVHHDCVKALMRCWKCQGSQRHGDVKPKKTTKHILCNHTYKTEMHGNIREAFLLLIIVNTVENKQ